MKIFQEKQDLKNHLKKAEKMVVFKTQKFTAKQSRHESQSSQVHKVMTTKVLSSKKHTKTRVVPRTPGVMEMGISYHPQVSLKNFNDKWSYGAPINGLLINRFHWCEKTLGVWGSQSHAENPVRCPIRPSGRNVSKDHLPGEACTWDPRRSRYEDPLIAG